MKMIQTFRPNPNVSFINGGSVWFELSNICLDKIMDIRAYLCGLKS